MDAHTGGGPLYGLSLFSGIGGLDLGLGLALPGLRTACFVEREAAACRILAARMADGILPPALIHADVTRFDGGEFNRRLHAATGRGVGIIFGGFPCQDVSLAGRRAGVMPGTRSGLWYEFARIIREIRPGLVFVENVSGLLSGGLDVVLGELAAIGFDAEWLCLRASDVGAPHRRERVFILGVNVADSKRTEWRTGRPGRGREGGSGQTGESTGRGNAVHSTVADTEHGEGGQRYDIGPLRRWAGDAEQVGMGREFVGIFPPGPADRDGWARVLRERPDLAPAVADSNGHGQHWIEESDGGEETRRQREYRRDPDRRGATDIGADAQSIRETQSPVRVLADGSAAALVRAGRVDALRALGNAVVPLQAAAGFRILAGRMGIELAAPTGSRCGE